MRPKTNNPSSLLADNYEATDFYIKTTAIKPKEAWKGMFAGPLINARKLIG